MNGQFYLACVRMLAEDNFTRVMVNAGINQSDMDLFRGSPIWTSDLRSRLRRVLDALVYGLCDMAQLPRVDVPAEMPAAIIAMTVAPSNWMIAASWQAGLKPARDLQEAEETVQVERVSAGRMLTLILHADAAMRNCTEYEEFAERISARFSVKVVPGK